MEVGLQGQWEVDGDMSAKMAMVMTMAAVPVE